MVHEVNNTIKIGLRNCTEIKSFGEDSAKSAVGIFILAPLPWVVGMGKIYTGLCISFDHFPQSKLASAVVGDGSLDTLVLC